MDFKAKSKTILEKIKSYQESSCTWKEIKKSKLVTVWSTPSPEWNGILYKAEATLHASPDVVFRYIEPSPDGPRMSWDKAIKSLQVIQKLDENTSIVRCVTHSGLLGVVASRDFIDLSVTVRDEDVISTNAAAIEHPDWPAQTEPVRGTNHPCSIACKTVDRDPGSTRMLAFFQSDLSGLLPQNVVDMALPSNICRFFSDLQKALEENGHQKTNGTS